MFVTVLSGALTAVLELLAGLPCVLVFWLSFSLFFPELSAADLLISAVALKFFSGLFLMVTSEAFGLAVSWLFLLFFL